MDADAEKANRVTQALMPMHKIDIATLERALRGQVEGTRDLVR